MATTITAGSVTITPTLVEGYAATAPARTLVHDILGRTAPDITLRPAGLRTGTLTLLIAVEARAVEAFTALCAGVVCTLASDERSISMPFIVPDGQQVGIKLDDTTRDHWHITVPFQEVAP